MRIVIKLLFIAVLVTCFTTSCKDNSTSASFDFITGPEGSDITLEYPDGTKENIGSDRVFGWATGALLGGNYFRQLRVVTEEGTLAFRLSFPDDISPDESVISRTHELRGTRLLLESSGNISEVTAELWFKFSDQFDGLTNATGRVTIEQSVSTNGRVYDVTGEINAEIVSEQGQNVKITGNFWKQDAD
jgi:hypothetical protein